MGSSVAGGRYRVTWRERQWVVRSPDGKTAERFGDTDKGKAEANVWADRANEKLKAIEQR